MEDYHRAEQQYRIAKKKLLEIWQLYHCWYDEKYDSTMFKAYPNLTKAHNTNVISRKKNMKCVFYKEIKKNSAAKHLAWLRYMDECRFNALSDIFYTKTRVDLEFARQIIYSYIR